MAPEDSIMRLTSERAAWFPSTHWSVVLAAGRPGSPAADEALEKLCRTYWYPLYSYVRHRGFNEHDAQDLVQEFFARLLERNFPGQADPRKGKFRSFLLITLNHFLSDERTKASAQKRGGGRSIISLDAQEAEERYRLEAVDEASPDKLFGRHWAQALLDKSLAGLREEYRAAGKGSLFEVLQHFQLGGQASLTYAEAATRLGLSEPAVKTLIHRLRERHRKLVREEIAQTVSTAGEIDEELRHLRAALSG
jgi:RNA polymerase sigma-70 factor (ECF subfamily)